MRFVTDFADQAVILPAVFGVALVWWLQGWRRGAVVSLIGVGVCLGIVLGLKLIAFGCVPALGHPSGHTAAAAVVYGGVLGLALPRRFAIPAAVGAALLIGATRVALGLHSVADVVLGGAIGIAGAVLLRYFVGVPPPGFDRRPAITVALAAMLLLHGTRLNAEETLRRSAVQEWMAKVCK